MNDKIMVTKKNYYLNPGISQKYLEVHQPLLLEYREISIDEVFEYILEPERLENMKTKDSDPEFARWDCSDDIFM